MHARSLLCLLLSGNIIPERCIAFFRNRSGTAAGRQALSPLPDDDPVFRREIHSVAFFNSVGLKELVELLKDDDKTLR